MCEISLMFWAEWWSAVLLSQAIYVYQKAAILSMMPEQDVKTTGESIVELFRWVRRVSREIPRAFAEAHGLWLSGVPQAGGGTEAASGREVHPYGEVCREEIPEILVSRACQTGDSCSGASLSHTRYKKHMWIKRGGSHASVVLHTGNDVRVERLHHRWETCGLHRELAGHHREGGRAAAQRSQWDFIWAVHEPSRVKTLCIWGKN